MKFHNYIVAPAKFLARLVIVLVAVAAIATPSSSWAAKPDRTPPTVPTITSVTASSCSQVNLSWTASTDASGVKQYNVYRNGSLLKTVAVPSTSTSDAVSGSTYYSYTVSAVDNKGNTSAQSSAAGVTTPACTTGTVTISLGTSPSGAGTPTGGGTIALNSTVTVNANPSSCYNFVSWTENGTQVSTSSSYSFTATANRNLVANYSQKSYSVSVGASAGGSVSGGGTYSCGSSATVTATAASCYHFVNWTENGTVVSTSTSYAFTVSASRSLVANFAQNTYTISTGVSPASSGTTSGGGTYGCGSTATVSASATAGYTFVNWTENGTAVSSSSSYSFAVGANRALTANFAAASCAYSLNSSSASIGAAGGSSSFGITTGGSCSWTASTAYSWITLNSSSGTGNGNIYYTVAINASTSSRSGTITVGGQTFTVTQTGDTSAPTVSLTSPNNGSTLSNTVPTTANASDPSTSVSRVEFYRDAGVLIGNGTANGSSYTVSWDTTAVPNGTHSVYAKAYDVAGNATVSTANSVTVNNAVATTTPSGQLVWLQTNLPQYQARVNGIATDHSGNVIAVGQFYSFVDFGNGLISGSGSSDGFIAKYSPQGLLIWVKHFGSVYYDNCAGVAIDSGDNIIITGAFQGSTDFGGGTITANGGATDSDAFVAKYSPAGTYLWGRNFGSGANDYATGVAVDKSDNVVVISQSGGSVNFGNGLSLTGHGSLDVAIAKFSGSTGATLWAQLYGGSYSDLANGVSVDGSGDVFVTGSFSGSGNLGGTPLVGSSSSGIFVAKYSGTDGTYKWSSIVGGTAGYGIAADPSTGNVFVTGQGASGFFLNGYDTGGNTLWSKVYGNSGDAGRAIAVDGAGNLALTGACGSVDWSGNYIYSNGSGFFLASFTTTGNLRWNYQSNDYAAYGYAISFDTQGHVDAGGGFQFTADFGGVSLTAGSGVYNTFIGQYGK